MRQNLQRLSLHQRRLIFILIFVGVLLALASITLLLVGQALTSAARVQAVALIPSVTVTEFAILPDDDAFPAAVAVAPGGMVYTGSFATGAVWAIDARGEVTEIPGTRDAIGAVIGLAVAPDGALLVVDQLDTDPRTAGGEIIRIGRDGTVRPYVELPDGERFVAPTDIAFDPTGAFYVSDAGPNQVWRFTLDQFGVPRGEVWWTAPPQNGGARQAISGLAYDPVHDALIVAEPETNVIYRVRLEDRATEILYRHGSRPNPPGFNGVAVTEEGRVFVAALGQNGVALVEEGNLNYIAGLFRGASDVAVAGPDRLVVTNFDQSSLVLPLVLPQLPFALDMLVFDPAVLELSAP